MSDHLIHAKEVAERLGLRPSTIYAAAYRGAIPFVRILQGKRRSVIRFKPDEIESLIREGSVNTRPSSPTSD